MRGSNFLQAQVFRFDETTRQVYSRSFRDTSRDLGLCFLDLIFPHSLE